ncbi:hypothetical protein A2U01_0105867, partial [Trifolium medium]|nr:hypothetical protein [Trifolium medium]
GDLRLGVLLSYLRIVGDCIGELDLPPRLGGIRRIGEGDLRRMLGDLCCMGEGALLRLTGDGDLRRCIGE